MVRQQQVIRKREEISLEDFVDDFLGMMFFCEWEFNIIFIDVKMFVFCVEIELLKGKNKIENIIYDIRLFCWCENWGNCAFSLHLINSKTF